MMLLSGCGESDSTADGTAPISKAEFVKQADAICAKTSQELIKAAENFSKEKRLAEEEPLTEAQIGELSELALPIIVRQFEEIRALGAPPGDEEKVNAILAAAEKGIAKGEQDPAAIYGADGGVFKKANQLSSDYGLKKCSE